jgi:hypothetical protein
MSIFLPDARHALQLWGGGGGERRCNSDAGNWNRGQAHQRLDRE